jgi:hypothetical protein
MILASAASRSNVGERAGHGGAGFFAEQTFPDSSVRGDRTPVTVRERATLSGAQQRTGGGIIRRN